MPIFQTPILWADFTGASPQRFINDGVLYPNFNAWLAAAGGTFSRSSTATDLVSTAAAGAFFNSYSSNVARLTPSGILLEGSSTNLLLNSGVPVTQTVTLGSTGSYTLWVNGSGSATSAAGSAGGSGFGTATNGSPNTFTISSTGTVTITVSGSLNVFQLENLGFPSSYIPTTGSSASRSTDQLTVPWVYNTGTILAITNNTPTGSISTSQRIIGITGPPDATLGIGSSNQTQVFTGVALINATLGSGTFAGTVASAISGNGTTINVVGNAGVAASATSPLFSVSVAGLVLGADNSFNNSIFCYISQFGAWNTVFTVAQLQSVTTPNTSITFGISQVNLTSGKYFSRRDYNEWLDRIIGENEEARRAQEKLMSDVEAERSLTDTERADRDYNNAEEEYGQSESALFNNLTSTNHIKFSEAKERRDKARKQRDHHYYMAVVKKAWDEYNNK